MNIPEKNGQPSMEEILASIRRIIAEEPSGSSQMIDLRARPRPTLIASLIDEQADFELPAIFRPSAQPSSEKHTPLFGRLTDAIRNASGVVAEPRTPVRANEVFAQSIAPNGNHYYQQNNHYSDHGNGTNVTNGASGSNGSHGWPEPEADRHMPEPALSQLSLARDAAMASEPYELQPQQHLDSPAVGAHHPMEPSGPSMGVPSSEHHTVTSAVTEWWNGSSQPPAPVLAAPDDVKRVMVPFKDMRMSQMGGMSSNEQEPSSQAAVPAPAVAAPVVGYDAYSNPAVDFGAIIPAHLDTLDIPAAPSRFEQPQNQPRPVPQPQPYMNGRSVTETEYAPRPPQHAPYDAPYRNGADVTAASQSRNFAPQGASQRPTPPGHEFAPAGGGVEDATADLLRPMLRQWLAENMPRMVEKALHIEVAESLKPGKKPGSNS